MYIRPATPDDAPELVRLINELAAYERLAHESRPDEARLRAQLAADARPRVEALVAVVDERTVGFALFFHSYSTFLTNFGMYLEDLYVEESSRGRGIGYALLTALVRLAAERGCQRLEWSVLDWNEPAIAFYRQLGAEPLDDWLKMRLDAEAIGRLSAGAASGEDGYDGPGTIDGFTGSRTRGGGL
ncbi:MAG: GNAT family N-acetyltransferase [Rhodothermales bacterium]